MSDDRQQVHAKLDALLEAIDTGVPLALLSTPTRDPYKSALREWQEARLALEFAIEDFKQDRIQNREATR